MKFFKNIKFIKYLVLLILCFIILCLLIILIYKKSYTKYHFENSITSFAELNSENIFSVDKIYFFSSAFAENSEDASNWIFNIHQYTDIALYINNHNDGEYTEKNTIKNLSISNIKFNNKNILRYGKLVL